MPLHSYSQRYCTYRRRCCRLIAGVIQGGCSAIESIIERPCASRYTSSSLGSILRVVAQFDVAPKAANNCCPFVETYDHAQSQHLLATTQVQHHSEVEKCTLGEEFRSPLGGKANQLQSERRDMGDVPKVLQASRVACLVV